MTSCARSPQLRMQMNTFTQLAACRKRVAAAGCHLRPEWAGGAWVLFPLQEEQVFGLLGDDLQLDERHIIVRTEDVKYVRAALRRITKLRVETATAMSRLGDCGSDFGKRDAAQPDDTPDADPAEFSEVIVEKTFWAMTAPSDAKIHTSKSLP